MGVRIALAQFVGTEDVDHNVSKVEELVGEAAAAGAQLVCFHEFATTLYFCYEHDDRFFEWAQPVPGPATERVSKAAEKHGIDVIFPLYEGEGDQFWNTITVIQPGMGVTGKYRKSHVPTTTWQGKVSADERYYFNPGDTGFNPLDTSCGLKVGFLPCYDRHFPEGFRAYALRGTDIVFCPSASYKGFANSYWVEELQVMAFQHVLYVAGVNKVGPVYRREGHVDFYPGRSVIIDPTGQVLALAGHGEGIITAEVDPALVEKTRNDGLRIYDFRRPDLYDALIHRNLNP